MKKPAGVILNIIACIEMIPDEKCAGFCGVNPVDHRLQFAASFSLGTIATKPAGFVIDTMTL